MCITDMPFIAITEAMRGGGLSVIQAPVGSVDWLRQVECPSDIADANVGWITAVVGQKYGSGYGLEVKARWMSAIAGNN